MIRRTILFDNQCGFALGENSRAPNPFVTWRFNEQDGHRDYFWGHYMNEPDMAERDLLNRAEDYQRRYHVQEVEQAPDKETYRKAQAEMRQAVAVKANIDHLLGHTDGRENKAQER